MSNGGDKFRFPALVLSLPFRVLNSPDLYLQVEEHVQEPRLMYGLIYMLKQFSQRISPKQP